MAIYLNARNELLFRKHIFLGTLNASLVHPREIFNMALEKNAVSIILVHNHPSGDPNPSEDDLQSFQKDRMSLKFGQDETLSN
jgi:DNA repair protein RadC